VAKLKLKIQTPNDDSLPWWERIAGSFEGDPLYFVLAQDATLLTKNLSDFRKVPGLKVEDWTLPSES